MTFKSIKEILEPSSRYLFLDDEGMNQAFLINSVEKNTFVIMEQQRQLDSKERKGYFVAASGKGVVRFTGQLNPLPEKDSKIQAPLTLYKLEVNLKDLKLINRREFIRHELKTPIPISFNYEGRFIQATLVNISEGGLRMSVGEPLPTNLVFHFEINLPLASKKSFYFKTDGLIVYSDPEEKPTRFMTGVSFIAPHFSNEEEKRTYVGQKEQLSYHVKHDFK